MKVRTGFVSNSSSSSFVIGFPKEVESKVELGSFLFPDDLPEKIESYYKGDDIPLYDFLSVIFNDLKEGGVLDTEQLRKAFNEGYVDGDPSLYSMEKENESFEDLIDRYDKRRKEHRSALFENFLDNYFDKATFYKVEYEDDGCNYECLVNDILRDSGLTYYVFNKH